MTLTGMVMAWDGNAADGGTTIVPGAVPQQSSYPVQRAARQPSRVYPFPSAGSVTIALGRIAFSVAR
jgi:hypothetical protein